MPTKRQRATRNLARVCDPDHWRMMLDMEPQNPFTELRGVPREVWDAHKDAVLAEWARSNPGTRPTCWWKYDAPQELVEGCKGTEYFAYAAQRQRLGGRGEPAWLHINITPCFEQGVPAAWISREAAFRNKGRRFIDASVDPTDPPTFEGEAEYLRRLQFFLDGERQRTARELFEPVQVSADSDDFVNLVVGG